MVVEEKSSEEMHSRRKLGQARRYSASNKHFSTIIRIQLLIRSIFDLLAIVLPIKSTADERSFQYDPIDGGHVKPRKATLVTRA